VRPVWRGIGLCVVVAGAAALVPAAAQARTKSVTIGLPASQQSTFNNQYGADVNDYFPHRLTIRVGDKVKFKPAGFHTVEFPAKGDAPVPFALPDGKKIAGLTDAAGAQFWFNGADELNFNPVLFPPGLYGRRVSYDGSKDLQSGLPLVPKPKAFTVRFKKAGKQTYYCNLHPGMIGVINVKKRHARIPSAKADRKTLKAQIKRDLKIAKGLATRTVPAGTVDVGEAGAHGVEYFGMLPGTLRVPAGTTVKFRMTQGSFEDHTATFGPGSIDDPKSYIGAIASSFEGAALDQRGVYPSERPGTIATYGPGLHGNGFWNTGVIDASNSTPLPESGSVTFGTRGTYNYYCLIHPFMHGQVVVQ
jgi:plastocyanin